MMKIVVVEDEYAISEVLNVYLQQAGYDVVQCYDGALALDVISKEQPQLVLLDVMLPHKDGWHILQEVRQQMDCAVIMLTALGDVTYRLDGFAKGADDYIAKPFHADEVVARVKAVLKRTQNDVTVVSYGALTIDFAGHFVKLNGNLLEFTPRDLALFLYLAQHPNRMFTRDQLLEHVWGWSYDGSDRAVDLSIKRIRKVLHDWPETDGEIRTLRGVGYQLYVHENAH